MGSYRLLLAILVAISHMGITVVGLNVGVIAVISFLIISGFVMTSLIERNYRTPESIHRFYVDRVLRLYPQFLLYLIASCAVIYFLLPGTPQATELTLKNIVANLSIIPLGFYMFEAVGTGILPPAWSLGLEMCFYLVIPFLIIYKARGPAFALSTVVFLIACLGLINTDVYGYRLLPGVLFIFLCGSYLYRAEAKGLVIAAGTTAAAALMFLAIMTGVIPRLPFNAEVTAGIALGIPAVFLLSKLKFHRIDELFGNISYGVFLNHFVVMYFFRAFWPVEYSTLTVTAVLVLSFLLSGLSYYCIERPALKLRHALRTGVRYGDEQLQRVEVTV
ncbi:acyltransferase family protein [Pseudomonas sp. 6D_7.1_Bac1]|uniref:acyltransferase family protein n=1 Tax=Pseudomonas sp. 6D_7.1_Bac1 TaxID=2971615 RepID=UPI0021C721D7|nr:acyltransferase [Pseudomonas sp. 6D_7.1_Bac1]MCU1752110.1 acyltransferase [Pseudomonas sp. 6D_7.1_Bac1]